MFKVVLRTSLLASAMIGGAAYAQDRDPAQDFNGVYIGGFGGYTGQNTDQGSTLLFDTNRDGTYGDTVRTITNVDAFSPGFCGGSATVATNNDCSNDNDDFEYGGRIGVDRRMGNFVVGIVLECGRSEATDSVSGFSTTPARYTLTREQEYSAQARLRAGYTPGGGVLFYATGGGAYARLDNSFTTSNGVNSFADNGKTNAWGWSAGGGAEAMLSNNISLGLEYLYTDLQDDDYTVNVGAGTAPLTNPFLLNGGGTNIRRSDDHFRTHGIRATVNVRF
jgi:outer membrane immunogenic protein